MKKPTGEIPRFWQWLLKVVCPTHLREGILSDLEDQYYDDLDKSSVFKSRWRLAISVFMLIHPVILLKKKFFTSKTNVMITSYLKLASRSMKRNKLYSFTNTLGLSFSISLIYLVILFVHSEFSKDEFHVNKDSIYRIYTKTINRESGEVTRVSSVQSIPFVKNLYDQFDQVINFSRWTSNPATIFVDNVPFNQSVHFVDPGFFEMFSFPVVDGNISLQLNDVILSPEIAKTYFGDEDPIGKELRIDINGAVDNYVVAALVDNMGNKSSTNFQVVLNMQKMRDLIGEEAYTSGNISFVNSLLQLADGVSDEEMQETITDYYTRNNEPEGDSEFAFFLEALPEVYLTQEVPQSMFLSGNLDNIYILSGLSILVLVIAFINFLTLSTSQALKRIKEVGVRKAIGAQKHQLRTQLAVESFFTTFLSGLLGLLLAYFLLPSFNELAETNLTFDFSAVSIGLLLLLILLIAFISGTVQAILLVKVKGAEALRGMGKAESRGGKRLSQVLVVIQFTLSIGLVIGTAIMREQLYFMNEMDLGYERERLLMIRMNGPGGQEEAENLLDRFRNEAAKDPNVLQVSAAMNDSIEPWTRLGFGQADGTFENLYFNLIDPDFVETMGMEIVLGDDFDLSHPADLQNGILVNEALVKHFGWTSPLNARIPGGNASQNHRIIGVVKDFHFSDLREEVAPLIMAVSLDAIVTGRPRLLTYRWPAVYNGIVVRAGAGAIQPVISNLEEIWSKVNPGKPFQLDFEDEVLNGHYADDLRWQKIIDSASAIAIAIAWLGLIGLTRLSVQKRIKEIGIRKVLGSSVWQVLYLLSKRMLILIAIANLLAWPFTWKIANDWLTQFAFRVNMNITTFLLVGIAVLAVAMGSVMLQVLQTAKSNPVKALRHD